MEAGPGEKNLDGELLAGQITVLRDIEVSALWRYFLDGEEEYVPADTAKKAIEEFEEYYMREEDTERWEGAKEEGFEDVFEFVRSGYDINLEEFF